jgi:hypothetical protein
VQAAVAGVVDDEDGAALQ